MFDRSAHIRSLSADKAIVARRRATVIDRHGVKWTPAMDAALTEMANARFGYRQIAKRVGVCRDQIETRRRELGLPLGRSGRRSV